MKATRWLSLVLPVALVACGGGGGSSSSRLEYDPEVDHPFFPLTRGVVRTFEGTHEGVLRTEVHRTLAHTRDVAGVECTGVREDVFDDGELVEVTTEWYAEDGDGNVWKFGEESLELEDGSFVLSDDSWLAGQGGFTPWMAFPHEPRVGEVITGYSPEGEEQFHVISVHGTAKTPAGTFENCLEIIEDPDDPDDTDIILYARGVGKVTEESREGQIDLVRIDGDR